MVKYVEGNFDEDYIQTLGVNYMEKTISIRNTEITFSIWDLGGMCVREFACVCVCVCVFVLSVPLSLSLSLARALESMEIISKT